MSRGLWGRRVARGTRALPTLGITLALVAHAAPPQRLARVDIEGNVRVEKEAIRVHLRAKPGMVFDPAVVDGDVRAVYGMGFFDDVEAHLTDTEAGLVLTYRVKERPFIREVRIQGNKKLSRDDLEAALKIRPRTIYNPLTVHEGIQEAKRLYEGKGYLDASIRAELEPPSGREVAVVYHIDEGSLVRIKKIDFEGNRALSDRKLRGVMATKQAWFLSWLTGAGVLNREVLKTDIERLTAYYYDQGYIDVRIDEPIIERRKQGLFVRIKVDEGKRYRVGKIDFEGDLVRDRAWLAADLRLKEGEVFRASQLRKDVLHLTDKYGDLGYAFVNVEPDTRVHPAEQLVDIVFRIDKGPEVYFDKIEITGNTKTRDKVIRRELKINEQGRFSSTALRRSREALQRLGFFQEVNITTRRSAAEDRLAVLVDVKEGQTGAFSAGAGFSSADRLLFNVQLSERNLFGRGQHVVLNADFGTIRQNFILRFTEPYLLGTRLTGTGDLFNWRLEFDDFTRKGTGLGFRGLYPLEALGVESVLGVSLEEVRLGLRYRLEQAEITNLAAFTAPSIRVEEGTSLTSSIAPTVVRNTLNHPFDPTRGSLQELSLEFAGLGGESQFVKADARARFFRPLLRVARLGTFTYSLGVTVGWGRGDRGLSGKELPLFERYFPGGIGSVRGFETRTLGPREEVRDAEGRVVDRTPVGGSRQLVATSEIIIPLLQSLGVKGVLFFDAGNAFTDAQGFDLGDLRYAAGWGLRWLSPFGPLRIEVGYPLNPREDEKRSVVLFSFGGPL